MRTSFVAFLLAALAATLLTPIMRALAKRLGVLDRPIEARKVHKEPVPRLGGLAIMLGMAAPLVGMYFYRNAISEAIFMDGRRIAALLTATLIIVAAGLLDDVKGLAQRYRFVAEGVAGAVVYWGGFRIDGLALPFVGRIDLGPLGLAVTIFWVVAVINAINFTDGLDGLAAGTSVITAGTLFILALHYRNYLPAVFSASIAGAAFGFLLFNFHPATVYMGDTGSMFLGFALAVTAIGSSQKNAAVVAILGPLLALGLPIGDTVLRVVRRVILGQPWFPADRKHVHHRLLDLGLSHRNSTLVLYAATAVFSSAALAISLGSPWMALAICAFILGCVVFAVRKLGFAEFNRFGELRSRQVGEGIEQLIQSVETKIKDLSTVDNVENLWDRTLDACSLFRVDRLEWSLAPGLAASSLASRSWLRPEAAKELPLVWTPQEKEAFCMALPLEVGFVRVGLLTLTREPGRSLPFNGVERMAARLWASQLATALRDVAPLSPAQIA